MTFRAEISIFLKIAHEFGEESVSDGACPLMDVVKRLSIVAPFRHGAARTWPSEYEKCITHDAKSSSLSVDRYGHVLGRAINQGYWPPCPGGWQLADSRRAVGTVRAVSHPEGLGWRRHHRAHQSTKCWRKKSRTVGLPTINVSWYPYSGERIARCTVDPEATGKMAAEYFLSAGFEQFGYCGPLHMLGYSDTLAEAFRQTH